MYAYILAKLVRTIENFSFFISLLQSSSNWASFSLLLRFAVPSFTRFLCVCFTRSKQNAQTHMQWSFVCVFVNSYVALCMRVARQCDRNSTWSASPNLNLTHNLHVCRPKRNYSIASLRHVGLVSSAIVSLASTSEQIVITSSFIIVLCRQTGYAEALPCEGIAFSLLRRNGESCLKYILNTYWGVLTYS